MINPQPGATIYEQVAARLREQITKGQLKRGQVVPSERTLAQELAVGRQTVNHAMRLLRAEGLLEYRRGQGLFVREPAEPVDLEPPSGSTAVIRMPTAQERSDLGLGDGVPIIAVTTPDGGTTLYPGDRQRLRWP